MPMFWPLGQGVEVGDAAFRKLPMFPKPCWKEPGYLVQFPSSQVSFHFHAFLCSRVSAGYYSANILKGKLLSVSHSISCIKHALQYPKIQLRSSLLFLWPFIIMSKGPCTGIGQDWKKKDGISVYLLHAEEDSFTFKIIWKKVMCI